MAELNLWTVYDKPTDFPEQFVARKFVGEQPTSEHVVADTLVEVRAKLPSGLICMPRQPGDEPQIVEVWL